METHYLAIGGLAMPVLELESTLTDKYQTTVPSPVRKALKLGKRDRIVFRVDADRETVTLAKHATADDADPVIASFLAFITRDLVAHPERLRPLPASLIKRARALTAGMKVDLDEKLPPDDE
jgi:antitoxin PrlF